MSGWTPEYPPLCWRKLFGKNPNAEEYFRTCQWIAPTSLMIFVLHQELSGCPQLSCMLKYHHGSFLSSLPIGSPLPMPPGVSGLQFCAGCRLGGASAAVDVAS